jgi:hypothetical protein
VIAYSELNGSYACGIVESGTYDVEIFHEDYPSKMIEDVELSNGELTELDVVLSSFFTNVSNTIDERGINIYPNPSTASFTLEMISGDASINEVMVFDLTGRMIEEISGNDLPRKISFGQELPQGTYFVRMINERGQHLTKKVAKL